jgi:phosphoglycolate phosphatase
MENNKLERSDPMIDFANIKTIVFDYDGTLHNSIKVYAPAFTKAYQYLVENGFAEKRSWSEEEISYWLGFNSQEMWNAFMPDLSLEAKELCSRIIGEEMKKLVEEGSSNLYDGAIEILDYLKKKGYHLVFLSNCKLYYRDAHKKTFALDRYFEDMVCSEEHNFIPKYEILSRIKSKYPEKLVIVGDRAQDIEAGIKNDIFTIGCTYGYALQDELKDADMLIHDIIELKNYF